MNIIFLDIDGVLNSGPWMNIETAEAQAWWRRFGNHQISLLDPKNVAVIAKLVHETGAKVVISSSWREAYSIELIKEMFSHDVFFSINHIQEFVDAIIDRTPLRKECLDNVKCRGHEIQEWLNKTTHKVESFVILDDQNDMKEMICYTVLTDFEKGLTENNALTARGLLENGPS